MARARGARETCAIAFETTYGTAPGSGFLSVPFVTNGLTEARPLLEDDILGTRDPGDHALDVAAVDGDIAVPMDCEAIGVWLKAAFGAPTTTENAGVYTHVFQSNAWSLPSMAIERAFPDVASYHMATGVMLDRLQFSMQRGGLLNGTMGLIGQALARNGSSQAGTPTAFAQKRFTQGHGTVSIDGSTVANIVRSGLNYQNGLERVDTITSDGNIAGLDPTRAALSWELAARFDSESLYTTAQAGTAVALKYELTRSASEKLTFESARVFLDKPRTATEGPRGIQATFNAMAAREADGDPMLTVTLINAVSSY